MKRVQISLDDDVLSRIDDFTSKSGLNRSTLLSMATMTYIEAQEQLPSVQAQLDELKKAISELQIK